MSADAHGEAKSGIFQNVIAIVGFIIVIVIVIWGLVHLASLSRSWFSSFFNTSASTVTVSVPASATAGVPFDVSWKYSPAVPGHYALLYQCQNTAQLSTAASNPATIPCGKSFNLPTGNSVSLTPRLAGATTTLPLTIVFVPNATGTSAQGSANIVIVPQKNVQIPPVVVTPTPPTPTPVVVKPIQTGLPDLVVRIVAIGTVDPYTGAFSNRMPNSPQDVGAVQFDIANNGTASSGTYYFTAQLPTHSGYTYSSPAQSSLGPKAHILNTLKFSDVNDAGGMVEIDVDPQNTVRESNEFNNTVSQYISGYYLQY